MNSLVSILITRIPHPSYRGKLNVDLSRFGAIAGSCNLEKLRQHRCYNGSQSRWTYWRVPCRYHRMEMVMVDRVFDIHSS